MLRPCSLSFVASLTLVVLLLASCGDTADDSADTTLAATTTMVETTATTAATTTVAPVTTTMADPTEASPESGEAWELVWFSDSTGFGLADLWGARIEQEFGIDVVVHDFARGGLQAAAVLDWLGDGKSSLPKMKDQVAEAEIIVVYGNPAGSGATSDERTCASTSTASREAPTQNSPEDWAPYKDVLESIYEIIFDLRDGQPTIVRAMDMYNPVIADWREAGIEMGCTASWEMMAQTVREAAASHGVPTVSMYDAFNGADHSEDPREKGYISADGQHTTDEGKAAMVDVLDAAGYVPIGG